MNKHLLPIILLAFVPLAADAQTLEVRSGATIGSISDSRAGLELIPSYSADVLAQYNLTDLFGVYGGAGFFTFGCEEQFCVGRTPTITGVHGILGAQATASMFWLRTGVMYGTTSVSTGSGFDPGIGFHTAAGVQFTAFGLQLRPGFSLESTQVNPSGESAIALSFDVGVAYSFSR